MEPGADDVEDGCSSGGMTMQEALAEEASRRIREEEAAEAAERERLRLEASYVNAKGHPVTAAMMSWREANPIPNGLLAAKAAAKEEIKDIPLQFPTSMSQVPSCGSEEYAKRMADYEWDITVRKRAIKRREMERDQRAAELLHAALTDEGHLDRLSGVHHQRAAMAKLREENREKGAVEAKWVDEQAVKDVLAEKRRDRLMEEEKKIRELDEACRPEI